LGVTKNQNAKTRAHRQFSRIFKDLGGVLRHFTEAQIRGLSECAVGMLHTQSCSRTQNSFWLSEHLQEDVEAVRKRMSRWVTNGARDILISESAPSLMKWIVSKWSSNQMALAIDMTHLSDKWIVMAVTVLYGQVGIPVNWRIFRADEKFDGKAHWAAMLQELKPAIPDDFDVLVLSDRGLWSPNLFRTIQACGWHPFMRVSGQGRFTPEGGSDTIHYLRDVVKTPGNHAEMRGLAYSKAKLNCTVLAAWDLEHKAPWIVLTDLPADHQLIRFYALRNWCEQTFKLLKRGGFDWHKTRMTDPRRAECMWLVFSVAMFWSILAAVRKGRRLNDAPAMTRHRLPTERNVRALVSHGIDIIRASTCSLLDLLAYYLPPPIWHISCRTFRRAESDVPL
jgi:hypothetical protein